MKRLFAVILTILLVLALTACGGNRPSPSESDTASTTATAESTSPPQTTAATTVEEARAKGFVIVTDYLPADGVTEVGQALQQLIDDNPNSTLYFPDGVYILERSLRTPADPNFSVDLQLSNYATLKAADDWDRDTAMIRLGAKAAANDIHTPGSNYSFTGGIVDGNGRAKAISIEGGRETAIRDVSIKNAVIGIHIAYGANNGSSDADIFGVNIVGNGAPDSVGILVEGYDNTISNCRIAHVYTGILLRSEGNILRNIHPLFYSDHMAEYAESCAFLDERGNNWYDVCYSDQFAVGFRNKSNNPCIYDSCFIMWYSEAGHTAIGFVFDRQFKAIINNPRISYHPDCSYCAVIRVGEEGGNGVINDLLVNEEMVDDDSYKQYVDGVISW